MKDIARILTEYRKKAGYSQKEVADLLTREGKETKDKSIYTWEKGRSTPNPTQFLLLCKIYGITDIYSTFMEPNPDNPLASLNDAGKEKVLDYIKLLELSKEYIKEEFSKKPTNNNIVESPVKRQLPLYLLPASAGSGEFLDGDEYELEEVGSEVPNKANFGIRLNGDSMEPRYLNGQIVWVQRTTDLLDGDIGIFYLDGNAYCKRLHKEIDLIELVSINPKYDPIKITEANDFRIYGRVVS